MDFGGCDGVLGARAALGFERDMPTSTILQRATFCVIVIIQARSLQGRLLHMVATLTAI